MSEVSICNLAITRVGGNPITSLDDNQTEAIVCKKNYASLRDAVLEASNWSFAKKRYKLNLDSTAPLFEYDNAFNVPAEVLRVIGAYRGGTGSNALSPITNWDLEDDQVLTNEGVVFIKAIRRVTNTDRYSSLFEEALSARLAAELAVPVTSSTKIMRDMFAIYDAKLDEAAGADGQQGGREKFRSNDLTGVRRTSPRSLGPTI